MIHLLIALLVNAVPIYGVVELGWSAPTVLVLFWFENLFGSLLHAVRIMLHSRLHPCEGHFAGSITVNGVTKPSSFLSGFLLIAVVFTLAHGVFVGFITFAMHQNLGGGDPMWRFDVDAFRLGTAGIAAFLLLDLFVDLPGLSKRSFAWLERVTGGRLARVLILHLGIVFGIWLLMAFETPLAILVLIMGLKALLDAAMSAGANSPRDAATAADH